ncbi:MAG TPA: FecR domain-containing protein [Pyrinomonadaceae bacterium]|jgi:ferric-dicitrate binding protein FerR (iron transport regulator)|nr:FecR domain-containing protein [Pyrinomonadaceae bacterium]
MKSNNDFDAMLDSATSEIRNESVDAMVVDKAAERVWARLAAETSAVRSETVVADRIGDCADFQSLIPAYLTGSLSEARSLLLVDHTHECIPCRKAMKDARSRKMAPAKRAVVASRYRIRPVILRWGIAAALVIGLGLVALPFIQRWSPLGGNLEATVQAAEGQVYQIADTTSAPVTVGEKLQKGDRIRTAKDAHALVRLGDGSVIEMKDRSEFSLTNNSLGTTIHLNRGAIVVEAAKQGKRHLFVDTGDGSHVSVTGTVFSVNSGTKGSRVSVIEGEVHLDHAGSERVLTAGEQATTNASIAKVPVKDEVAWSRKASHYAETLAAFSSLNKELAKITLPGIRNSTHLLDLMPENTIVYAALPNLTSTIVESHRIMQERINQNPALREWWEKEQGGHHGPNVDQVMGTVREFGEYLGDEIAVSVSMDEKGEPVSPLVLAELKNSQGLQQFIEQQIAKYSNDQKAGNAQHPQIKFVEDPLTTTATATEPGKKVEELYVWIQKDLFAASPKLNQLQDLANIVQKGQTSSFTGTAFHNRVAQVYQEGAGLVVAANLERVIEKAKPDLTKGANAAQRESALKQLGILNLKYFVLDQTTQEGKTHTQATVSFSEGERGIPSWLADPGPMGSLEYISPDANVVAGFVVRDPVKLVDDLLGVLETVSPDLKKNLEKQQADHGLDIRNDIAAPLGGEFAFAIDGPILPTPSWKMVFEVNDSAHLQQTLERVVSEVNKEAAKYGKAGLVWDRTDLEGRSYYTLRSADFGVEVNYTYVNGYMVMGPSRAMVAQAVKMQGQGYTLLRSSKFTAGLPADGNANFSAVFYHNLAPLVQPFADRIASAASNLPQEQQQAIKSMAADMPPTLAYAYARGDSITFAANTEGGPFGLSPASLLGAPNSLEMQHILQQGMKR